MNEKEIKDACHEAYLNAGNNAYFGNGFEAGVKFAEWRLPGWVSDSHPTVGGWYVVIKSGNRDVLMYNKENRFWCDFAGRCFKESEIEWWLNDKPESIS